MAQIKVNGLTLVTKADDKAILVGIADGATYLGTYRVMDMDEVRGCTVHAELCHGKSYANAELALAEWLAA
jgi:hypothetical protein